MHDREPGETMGDLWGLLLMLGFAAPLIILVLAVAFLIWRVDVRSRRREGPAAAPEPRPYPAVVRLVTWSCAATTFLLPWGVAIAVKLWLQSRGLPTHSWSSFLSLGAIAVLIPVTVFLWAFPFPLLGLFARYRYLARVAEPRKFKERVFVVGVSYLSGVTAGAFIFWSMFREFDILYVFVPVGLYIAVPMLVGWFIARSVLRLRERLSSHGAVAPRG
jgi:hypothetical protein